MCIIGKEEEEVLRPSSSSSVCNVVYYG